MKEAVHVGGLRASCRLGSGKYFGSSKNALQGAQPLRIVCNDCIVAHFNYYNIYRGGKYVGCWSKMTLTR